MCALIPLAAKADIDGGGYGYRRAQADSDIRTLRARSAFNAHANRLFAESKARYRLNSLKLDLNPRMIAQYGSGAPSAHLVLPKEVDQIAKFIALARDKAEIVVRYYRQQPYMKAFTDSEIRTAVQMISKTETLHLDYWGYINRTQRLPDYELSSRKLSYYAKWNERDRKYEFSGEAKIRAFVILGAIQTLREQ
jgi:hypothetical protein